jgi:hypothetical protein
MSLDLNQLILTGENPFIRLSSTDGGALTTNSRPPAPAMCFT